MSQVADLGSVPALLSLLFEVLVRIIVLLPLCELLKFKETCIYAHDVVRYCCQQLKDFESVLTTYGYISLTDEVLLKVLYMFTRVERIYHLALPPSFNSHQELSHYFNTHLIECFSGHPIGQLQFIHIPYLIFTTNLILHINGVNITTLSLLHISLKMNFLLSTLLVLSVCIL